MTGAPDCVVFVNLIDSVSINFKLQMSVDDFFNNNQDSNFVDRVCSFLGISTDRLKIVSGSNVASRRRFLANTTDTTGATTSDATTPSLPGAVLSEIYLNAIDANY